MSDRRTTPATARVAHISLQGIRPAARYAEGQPAAIAVPVAELCATPGGARDRQLLMGASVVMLDSEAGYAFVRADADGYCGWVHEGDLGDPISPTHRVCALSSHVYPEPELKERELGAISWGSRLEVVEQIGAYAQTRQGTYVPRMHLEPVDTTHDDTVAVAERFLSVPYLWGGNSAWGIDCSGLVQAAFLACGIPCAGDSDLQYAQFDQAVDLANVERGDLLFWPGHVALATGPREIIHANAHHMAVVREDLVEALSRIARQVDGELLGVRRPSRPRG